MRAPARLVCRLSLLSSTLLLAAAGAAQEARPASLDPARASTSAYLAEVLEGVRRVTVRDFEGAVSALAMLAETRAERPEAHCALADAQLALARFVEARSSYQNCEQAAEPDSVAMLRALVGLARTAERAAPLREARAAWARAQMLCRKPAACGLLEERIRLLDERLELDAAYEAVRRRIAERKALREGMR